MVRVALFAALLGVACKAPPAATVNASTVYNELVVAGCMAQDDGGPAAVAQEHALPDQEPWMACLWDGGTVTGCNVPCSSTSTKK
jgi:hypothetical protein